MGRGRKGRDALLRSLARALILNGKIISTEAKVLYIRGVVEGMVAEAKTGSIQARRRLMAQMANDREAVETLFDKVVPALQDKNGGFTKITKLNPRVGDNALMARIEWSKAVDLAAKEEKVEKSKKDITKKDATKAKSKKAAGKLTKSA